MIDLSGPIARRTSCDCSRSGGKACALPPFWRTRTQKRRPGQLQLPNDRTMALPPIAAMLPASGSLFFGRYGTVERAYALTGTTLHVGAVELHYDIRWIYQLAPAQWHRTPIYSRQPAYAVNSHSTLHSTVWHRRPEPWSTQTSRPVRGSPFRSTDLGITDFALKCLRETFLTLLTDSTT
jgi:hypothetical protein